MVVESQANRNEIEMMEADKNERDDKMEKLNLEVTVVVTEKMTMKKEVDRLEIDFRMLSKDYKQQR